MYGYSEEMNEIIFSLPRDKQEYLIRFLEHTKKLMASIDEAQAKLGEVEKALKSYRK